MKRAWVNHITGGALAAIFGAVILALRRISLWSAHYSDTGSIYLWNNCLKLLFFALVVWLFYAIGRFVLRFRTTDQKDSLRRTVFSILAGVGVVSLSMHVLGLLHLMFFPAVFAPALAVTAFSGGLAVEAGTGAWRRVHEAWRGSFIRAAFLTVLWGLVGLLFFYLAAAKGVYPDAITMDTVGHYMPFFRDSLSQGRMSISPYFFNYFTLKGAGIHFFFAALTDVQSLQMASLAGVLVICFVLGSVLLEATGGSSALALAAVIVLLCLPDLYLLEFQKIHAFAAALITGQWYVLLRMLPADAEDGRQAFTAGVLVTLALAVLLPVAALAISMPLLVLACLASRLQRSATPTALLGLTAIGLAAPVSILLANQYVFGLADLNPGIFFFALRNEASLAKHIDCIIPRLYYTVQNYDSQVGGSASFLLHRLLQVNPLDFIWSKALPAFWLVAAAVALSLPFCRRRSALPKDLRLAAAVGILLPLLVYGLNIVVKQESFATWRFGFLVYPAIVVLYVTAASVILTAVGALFRSVQARRLVESCLVSAMVLVALLHFPHNLGDDVRETFEFFRGKASYELRYSRVHTEIPACLDSIPFTGGKKVYTLFYAAGCIGMPWDIFRSKYGDEIDNEMSRLLATDANGEARIFLEKDREFFLVNLATAPTPYLFLPVFSAGSLRERFHVVTAVGRDIFLLKLGPGGDPALMDGFLPRYARYREAGLAGPDAMAMEAMMNQYGTPRGGDTK